MFETMNWTRSSVANEMTVVFFQLKRSVVSTGGGTGGRMGLGPLFSGWAAPQF